MKKTLFIVISLTLLISGLIGQNKVKFTYDAAGNRIKREIILSTKASVETPSVFIEELSEKTIKIYPNPTKGLLAVEISNYDNSITGDLKVYDMQGRLVTQRKIANYWTEVDLSNRPTGMYIMNITLGKDKSSWKIIKE